MKKISYAVNLLLLLVILLLFYCKPQRGADACKTSLCKDYSDVARVGVINASLAREMANAYRADSGKKYIGNGREITSIPDATSIWFGLEKLKQFICEIESRKCRFNCSDELGIRIYYAKYPDSSRMNTGQLRGLSGAYANHHTVFMIPTYYDARTGNHIDFDPLFGCRKPINFSDTAKPGIILFNFGNNGIDGQNHGSLIPPGNPPNNLSGPSF
jgi:hypothetical protein